MNELAPTVSLSFLVSQFGAHAAQAFARALEPLGLRVQDAGLIRMLSVRPGMTQVELSDLFGVLPSRMVALLDGLEGRGLVERARDPADRRRMRVALSAQGRKTARALADLTAAMDADLFRGLSAAERDTLEALLGKLAGTQGLRAGVHPAYRTLAREET